MFHLMRLADRLFGLDRRPRLSNGSRRLRRNHRPQVTAEVSLLEPRCLLSTGVVGTHQTSATSLHAITADRLDGFFWKTSNVSERKHPSGYAEVEVSWISSGYHPWDAIYGFSGFSLERGATYDIGYAVSEISGNKDSSYRINLQEAKAPYKSFLLLDEPYTDGKGHSAKITMPETVKDASLQFQFGGHGHRVFTIGLAIAKV